MQTLAIAYNKNKKYDDAEKLCLDILSKNAEDKFSWAVLGKAYLGKNNFPKAIEAIERALKIDPNYIRALTYLALIYNKMEKLELENKLYSKIISLTRIDSDAWDFLGSAHFEKGDYVKALEYINNNLTLNRYNDQAFHNLDRVYYKIKDNLGGTIINVDLSFVMKFKRDQSFFYFKLAKFLFSINKYNEALQACEKSLDYNPKKESALKLKQKLMVK